MKRSAKRMEKLKAIEKDLDQFESSESSIRMIGAQDEN